MIFRWGGGSGGGGNASIRDTPSPTDTALLVPDDQTEVAENNVVEHPVSANLYVEIPRSPPSYDSENGAAGKYSQIRLMVPCQD